MFFVVPTFVFCPPKQKPRQVVPAGSPSSSTCSDHSDIWADVTRRKAEVAVQEAKKPLIRYLHFHPSPVPAIPPAIVGCLWWQRPLIEAPMNGLYRRLCSNGLLVEHYFPVLRRFVAKRKKDGSLDLMRCLFGRDVQNQTNPQLEVLLQPCPEFPDAQGVYFLPIGDLPLTPGEEKDPRRRIFDFFLSKAEDFRTRGWLLVILNNGEPCLGDPVIVALGEAFGDNLMVSGPLRSPASCHEFFEMFCDVLKLVRILPADFDALNTRPYEILRDPAQAFALKM